MGIWSDLQLDATRHKRIALVGGGGKTTTLFALAHEAAQSDRRVCITTTTHMYPHSGLSLTEDVRELAGLFEQSPVVMLGRRTPEGKISGVDFPGKCLEECFASVDLVLVEADGARGLPLKAPADFEPVLPSWTDTVIACAGLTCLGQAISGICHRPERVCALLGVSPEHRITCADVAELLCNPLGGRKNVLFSMTFRCLLNQADTKPLQRAGREIQALLHERDIISAVHTYPQKERDGLCWFSSRERAT